MPDEEETGLLEADDEEATPPILPLPCEEAPIIARNLQSVGNFSRAIHLSNRGCMDSRSRMDNNSSSVPTMTKCMKKLFIIDSMSR